MGFSFSDEIDGIWRMTPQGVWLTLFLKNSPPIEQKFLEAAELMASMGAEQIPAGTELQANMGSRSFLLKIDGNGVLIALYLTGLNPLMVRTMMNRFEQANLPENAPKTSPPDSTAHRSAFVPTPAPPTSPQRSSYPASLRPSSSPTLLIPSQRLSSLTPPIPSQRSSYPVLPLHPSSSSYEELSTSYAPPQEPPSEKQTDALHTLHLEVSPETLKEFGLAPLLAHASDTPSESMTPPPQKTPQKR